MMEVRLLCVGKLKETFYADACREYSKRLGAYCKLSIVELGEERLPPSPSPAQIADALDREGARVLEKCLPGGVLVTLCVEGTTLSSPQLAEKISNWATQGQSKLTLVIGGSYGLSERVKEKSRLRLSMSPMTFPHHLARVMLLEQLYRSFKISEGSSYHK